MPGEGWGEGRRGILSSSTNRDRALTLPSPGVPGEGSKTQMEPQMIHPTTFPLFQNEPETDFSLELNQQAMRSEVAIVGGHLGKVVPVVIDGRDEISQTMVDRPDPSDTARIASRVHYASAEQATRAIDAADRAFAGWRDTPVEKRASILRNVAAYFRKHRFHIAAWGGLRGRQALARGGRRRGRGDRLLQLLRRRNGATRPSPCPQRARRVERVPLRTARRDGGHRAVEFSARHPHRHDRRGAGRGQYGRHQAGGAVVAGRVLFDGSVASCGTADWRGEFSSQATAKSSARCW